MAYKALYRTYRPQSFSEIIGQDAIVKTLQNEIKENKISHAYLFSGPRGTGKTSIARVFAKALNCTNSNTLEPCNECKNCKEITEGTSPDVIEIDAASNNGVDEIRAMKDRIGFLPAGAKYKIYIIDEVHMLSISAFNALLKTLEEPPKHVIFVLATTEPHKILPTVLSRCQRYDFKAISKEEIYKVLKNVCEKENEKYEEEALMHIAKASDGGLRDALSYLDQSLSFCEDILNDEAVASITGSVSKDKLVSLIGEIKNKNLSNALNIVKELHEMGKESTKIVISMLEFFKDALLIKNDITSNTNDEYNKLAKGFTFDELFYYIDILNDVQNKIKYNSQGSLYLQVGIIRIINTTSEELDYQKRICLLEEKIRKLETKGVVMAQNSSGIDPLKFSDLENNFNNLLSLLSKYELHKLNEKVNNLQNNINGISDEKYNKLENEISLLKQSIESIKDNYSAAIKESTNKEEIDLDFIEELIKNEISTYISELNISQNIHDLDHKIEEIESKTYKLISEALSKQKETKKVKSKVNEKQISFWGGDYVSLDNEPQVVNTDKIDFDDLQLHDEKEEITSDEHIENVLDSNDENIANVDTVLESEDVTNVDLEYETVTNEVESTLEHEALTSDTEETILDDEETTNEEENISDSIDDESITNIENETIDDLYETSSTEYDSSEESLLQETNVNNLTDLFNDDNTELNSNYDDFDFSEEDKQTEITRIELEKDETLNNEDYNNELIKAFNDEKSDVNLFETNEEAETINLFGEQTFEEKEEKVITEEEIENNNSIVNLFSSNDVKQEDNINALNAVKNVIEENKNADDELDEYERYDHKVLERILHDARDKQFAGEKSRIQSLWDNLIQLAPADKLGVAEILSEGKVQAVGNHEFVLIYDSAKKCNEIMGRKFKRKSLKLLQDLLNDYYNYLAITEQQWFLKREEYADQYHIGISRPKLTPFTDPNLKVVLTDDDKDDGEERLKEIFGDNLIIEKE